MPIQSALAPQNASGRQLGITNGLGWAPSSGAIFNTVWKQVFGDIGGYRLVEYGEISESANQFMDANRR
jgi:hypothetical protein